MIIGLTGTLGAGKTVILEYLQSQGFNHLSTSNEVREEAKKRGIELTRMNLINLANEVREKEGDGAFVKRVQSKMQPYEFYVIDGIRNTGEVRELRKMPHFHLISIDAPKKMRFQRLSERNRESDPKAWEEFLKVDAISNGKDQTRSGQQIAACMEMADFSIFNDGNLESTFERVKEVVEEIKIKSGYL